MSASPFTVPCLRSIVPILTLTVSLALPACFDGETRIIGDSPTDDASLDGGDPGGDAGLFPEGACHLKLEAESLDGFEGDESRWSAASGRITVAADTQAGRGRSLLLRGPDETCSDFTASVEFDYVPGAFPLLIGRATADDRWYGVGYDGTYGNLTATHGQGTELRDRIGDLDPVDLTPGAAYRLEMRVIDDAVLGLLFDEAAETPLAIVHGPASGLSGPGRIGLFEASGASMSFGLLRADPVTSEATGGPQLESARLVDPQTLILTIGPRQTVALTAPSAEGFDVQRAGSSMPVASVEVRPGTRRELLLRLAAPAVGGDTLAVVYDSARGQVLDASQQPLARVDREPVQNLLHADRKFEPFVDAFDGDRLDSGWHIEQREAFTVSAGAVRVSPTDPYATGAMLLRPIAERHTNSEAVLDFQYEREPSRGLGRVEAVVALRARSFTGAQYQAALSASEAGDRLLIRHVSGGVPTELVSVALASGAAPPATLLRLTFSATGPLLTASLALGDAPPLAVTAVRDSRILNAGPAGFAGQWDGTVRLFGVEVRETQAPPPFIASARVAPETPGQIDVSVLSASPLKQAGAPANESFTVWAGDRRAVTDVRVVDGGLTLVVSAPAIQGGQRVYLRYDASAAAITDSSAPPLALAGVDHLEVENGAAPGGELAVALARFVTPHTIDLVTTDNAALPIRVEGDVSPALTVAVNGAPVPVVAAHALGPPHGNVLRVTLPDDLAAADVVTLNYASGGSGQILDTLGNELRGFLGAPVEWDVPEWPPVAPYEDTFHRPDVDMGVGADWVPATPGLWSLRAERAVFQSAGVESLDAHLSRPGVVGPRYEVSARLWSSEFDPAAGQPLGLVFGSRVASDPQRPSEVAATFNFATRAVSLTAPDGAVTYGPAPEGALPLAAGVPVDLRLSVHGRAARAVATDADGVVLSSAQAFLRDPPGPGSVGLAGSAGARVLYFDDFRMDSPVGPPPNMLVSEARITPDDPNAVLLLLDTAAGASGEILTRGVGEGFEVTVEGAPRLVVQTLPVGSGLRVVFDGAPVSQRHAVTLSYDDRAGDVHDASVPVARPLDAFPPIAVQNDAEIGGELFVRGAESVGPWAIDVQLNPAAALPVLLEADAALSFEVRVDGRPLPLRSVVVLTDRPDRLRLVLGAALAPGQAVEVVYTPGVAQARVLDAMGRELAAGDRVAVTHRLEADEDFAPFDEAFGGVGAGIVNGWLATPERDWSRNGGDVVLSSAVDGVEGTLLRPALPALGNLDISATVRLNPPPFGPVAFGLVGRSAPGRSYRVVVEPADAQSAALTLLKTDAQGIRVLARTPLPPLEAGREYRLDARFHGPVLQAALFDVDAGGARLGELVNVDASPLSAGQAGLYARTTGQVRFHDVEIRPVTGYPAQLVPQAALLFTHTPRVVVLAVAAPSELGDLDGQGCSATVDGQARAVESVSASASGNGLQLALAGPDLRVGQAVAVTFDPTTGFVYDQSPVAQPLGPIDRLPVEVVQAPVLLSVEPVGESLLALTFSVAGGGELRVEGEGGIDVEVTAPALGPAPVLFGVDEVWNDASGDGQRLLLATAEVFPPGALVRLRTAQRAGARIVDAAGTPIADFGIMAIGDAATCQATGPFSHEFTASWHGEGQGQSGFSLFGAPDAFTELDGALISRGARSLDARVLALSPVDTVGRDLTATADFQIEADLEPFGRPAAPSVYVRAYNDGSFVGCTVRNEPGRIPLRDEAGEIVGPIDALGPALVCGRRLDFGPLQPFEGCRFQFFDTVSGEAVVRHDWAARSGANHRMTVSVADRHLRATLVDLDAEPPAVVAAVDVPDLGDDLGAGLGGVGSGDGGTVRFTRFSLTESGPADFAPLGPAFAPSGECD